MGVIAGLVAFGLTFIARPRSTPAPRSHTATALETRRATFEIHPGAAQVTVRSRDGTLRRDVDLSLVIDGLPRPLVLARDDLRYGADSLRAVVPVAIDEDTTADVALEIRADRPRDTMAIGIDISGGAWAGHSAALRVAFGSEGDVVFVAGVGQIADRSTVSGHSLLVDVDPHPLAVASSVGPILIDAVPENTAKPIEPIDLSITGAPAAADHTHSDLFVVVGDTSMTVWKTLADVAGIPTAEVQGRVTGTSERALVFGRDAEGNPQVRARVDHAGNFSLEVPRSVLEWYAAVDPSRASALASFVPGTPDELVFDVSPGGDLHVTLLDADSRAPLTARLLVHGIDGTVDPSFGPDYRASGAGPVIDALRGEVTTPLPSGHYRVAATKGIEWSIDAKIVDVVPGRVTDVELAPRHVVPTPGVIGCDLHVHARPSFDTPVTPEDRVVSLVAAGIEFAVPTEHNLVGDYSSALSTLDLASDLLSVPGVEVTTYSKGFGHFGVFPYPTALPVPPFKHTSMASIFHAVRAGDPNRYFQLNHPRLPKGIGYFNNIGFDPKAPRSHVRNRVDFDGIEVYNGYDNEFPDRIEQVLRDYWALLDFGWRYTATGSSDSHRIQFHWAGYPRTMVEFDPSLQHDLDSSTLPVDPLVVVANIKKGHTVVTSGPIVEFELGGVHPGDELASSDDPLHGHLRVRAAPWIDVTQVEVLVGQVGGGHKVVQSFRVPTRPTVIGPELGTLAEAQERTVRFDRDIDVAVGPENGWVEVIVRGERRMDDVLPFMQVAPIGFTTPVYVVRHAAPPPPFPGVGFGRP